MSDSDDPFGRRDRTIIRPNPGGRRPPEATPPPAPQQPPVPPAGSMPYPPPPPPPYQPPPPPNAPPPYQRPAGEVDWNSWMGQGSPPSPSPYQPPAQQFEPLMPAHKVGHVTVDLVGETTNPMMRAGSSLLLLLGRLRSGLSRGAAAQLMEQVAQAIVQFEIDLRDAGVAPDQISTAKYALAATADDIVQNMPSEDRHLWTQYSMLARLFGERFGGVRFFTELDRAKQNPALHLGLLELMHACLSLGFEGVHRTSAGGAGTLQSIRRDLYETIRRVQPKSIEDLSPHWRGQALALLRNRFKVPVWSVAAIASVLLLGVYLVLRNLLSDGAEAAAADMARLHPDTEIEFVREANTPPPPDPAPTLTTQLQRIRAALSAEIVEGKVSVDQTPTSIVIRIGNLALFASGQAKVIDSFNSIADRISETLDHEPGRIRIDGYSDNVPIKTVTFPSNWELSEARAKSVAALLRPKLADGDRIDATGKGSDNPVTSNSTADGRAKNRRVEISIPRAD
jgi:type VI secretion system protein ImpK